MHPETPPIGYVAIDGGGSAAIGDRGRGGQGGRHSHRRSCNLGADCITDTHESGFWKRQRSDRVVVLAPLLDDDLCFLQAVEDFTVQQLVA